MTAVGQVASLLSLRWRMLRTRRARLGVTLIAGLSAGIVVAGVVVAFQAPMDYRATVQGLLPGLLGIFLALALITGLAAGGGTEVIPADQLVSFPVSSRAVFLGSVVLAPLNFVWSAQVSVLIWVVAYVSRDTIAALQGWLLLGGFVGAATTMSLAISWWSVGVRQTRLGRILTTSAGLTLVMGILIAGWVDELDRVVSTGPLWSLASQMTQPQGSQLAALLVTLLLTAGCGIALGFWAIGVTLARTEDPRRHREGRRVRRRRRKSSPFRETLAVDRGSIWRSRPIRRGLVLMGLAPGAAAAVTATSWVDLEILPPLVAVGAALLFGINAFSLDGGGAVWLESTPRSARAALLSKAWVTGEVLLAAIAITLAAVALRIGPPEPRIGLALGLIVVVSVIWGVALSMRASVRRPHKAELRSARDTPAPPAAMMGHAARLAAFSLLPTIAFGVVLRPPFTVPLLLLVAAAFMSTAAWHLWRTWRRWRNPATRARVVTGVALG